MRKSLRQIKKQLKEVTKEMLYSLVGEENYEVIDWKSEKKGELNLEDWLQSQKILKPFKPTNFVSKVWKNQSEKTAQNVQHLVSILNGKFDELRIYGLGFPKLPKRIYYGDIPLHKKEIDPIGVPVFLFRNEKNWFGLMLNQGTNQRGNYLNLNNELDSFEYFDDIKMVFEGIDYQLVESSWNLKNSWNLEVGETAEETFSNLLINTLFLKKQTLSDFLNLENVLFEWTDEYPIPEEKILNDFLTENLNNLQVWTIRYIISREDWSVHYVWGQTDKMNWLGLQTVSYTF